MFLVKPPSIYPAELDTKFPAPEDFPTDENGNIQKDCRQIGACLIRATLNL